MRILYVTNGFPYPLTSGRLRHYYFLRELSRQHSITLVSTVGADFELRHARALTPFVHEVQAVPVPACRTSGVPKSRDQLERLLTGSSGSLRSLRSVIAPTLRRQPWDVVLCGLRSIAAFDELPTPRLILDLCDAPSLHVQSRLPFATGRQKLRLRLAAYWYRRLQEAACDRADTVLFASLRDRQAVAIGPARGRVIPNGVDTRYWRRTSLQLGRDTIVFTGAMQYPPNEDAALVLVREIFPKVRQSHPQAQLLIVGCNPTRALLEAGGQPGITVTGEVEDMRPFLERATVMAAPLRFGAGIQNKVLEAMAMEVPVVTSPLAADGLRNRRCWSPPVEIAESAEQFAEGIRRCLDERSGGPVHSTGRQWVTRHFSWTRAGRLLAQVLRDPLRSPAELPEPYELAHDRLQ